MKHKIFLAVALAVSALVVSAQEKGTLKKKPISQPLVKHIFTADPSAHVFNGKIYIYPSH
ncbi:MAG: family 43 glycosylhydrolase, partial [Sediminibacterium sp.]|nr:family 43 glycosylhydrolase [Sediminibacterium sp.]